MFAAEKGQRAFARSLGFEQARMTALFVDIVRIADDLPRTSHSYQGATAVADRAVHVYVSTQNAGEHAVGIALAEHQRALFEGNRNVALDQFFDQVQWQIRTAQACPKDCEALFTLTGQVSLRFFC